LQLQGPRAKLDWAVQKLEILDGESKFWVDSQPLRVVDEFDDEAGCHVLRIRRSEFQPVDHWRLGLMVGDVVHNARSALDQAAWLLACRSNPVEKLWEPDTARRIAFPVTRDPGRFKTHRVMPFLHEDAIAVLERLQPYQGGNVPECLGHLDALWNIDKHRVIHSLNVNLDISKVRFRPGAIRAERDLIRHPPVTTWGEPLSAIEDGAEIARIRFNEGLGPPHTVVKVEGQPTCEVAFGSGNFCFPVDGLGGLLVAVARALSDIEALPETPS
jgi:hypothetical protein